MIDVLMTYPEVVACSPIVEGRTFIRAGFQTEEAVSLQGIDLDLHLRTTDFAKQVNRGSIDDFRNDPNGCCVGQSLAERMNLVTPARMSSSAGRTTRRAASAST